jgi:dephospho-CoA kinase
LKIIGIAGESGSGKSTIARHLKKRGGAHIDADSVGHELLDNDAIVRNKILHYFGPDVFTSDGVVDRRSLGAVVFKDAELLKILNSILHPPILDACIKRANEMKRQGAEFAIIDAALLLEIDRPLPVDFTIALRCNKEEQVRRLLAKGGVTDQEIHRRLERQSSLQESFHRADIVLDTDGDLATVLAAVDHIVDEVLAE